MRSIALLLPALVFLPRVIAQAETWWQCGGFSWAGPTTCLPGVTCVMLSPYFSQCVPECQDSVTTTIAASSTIPAPTETVGARVRNAARAALQRRAAEVPIDIIALDGWAAGSYLQKASDSNAAILGKFTWMLFSQGESVRLRNPNISKCVSFLNLTTKIAETSYKPLVLGAVDTIINWNFNGPNSTLSTSTGFNNFVACSDGGLYLQTGSDLPSGNCTTTRLQMKRAY
ncbi:hypothetical protein B0J17DRAFT_771128 [Rhizoctonia solani]|nr:hypothetical protein B0J17DRAFT_771128 [Rhizoctonia solani]